MFKQKRIRSLFHRVTLSRPLTKLYDQFAKEQTLGQRGEREAERFFLRQGMVVIERGYADKFGEIDLILVDGDTIVFVEVKTRSSDYAGMPVEAVDEVKQAHITKTAMGFLKWNQLTDCRVRFDVLSIIWPDPLEAPEIVHYQSAFEATGNYQMY